MRISLTPGAPQTNFTLGAMHGTMDVLDFVRKYLGGGTGICLDPHAPVTCFLLGVTLSGGDTLAVAASMLDAERLAKPRRPDRVRAPRGRKARLATDAGTIAALPVASSRQAIVTKTKASRKLS